VDVHEYQLLLRDHRQEKLAESDPHVRAEFRAHLAKDPFILRRRRGRELIRELPAVREIRGGVRRHLEETLGLARVRVGRARLSGAFAPLDAHFKPLPNRDLKIGRSRPIELGAYRLYSSFEVPFTTTTDEGCYRGKVLVDRDDGNWENWRCRSHWYTPESIRQSVIRPRRRIIEVVVADQKTAEAVVRTVRPKTISVSVVKQEVWDRRQGDLLIGALHGRMKFEKLSKVASKRLAKESRQASTPLETVRE